MDAAGTADFTVQSCLDEFRRNSLPRSASLSSWEASYRVIPKTATQAELDVWHFGYLTKDAKADHNCVFPLARMRELEAEGTIGELSDPAYSFMGGIYSVRKVRDELAPKIVEELKRAQVDAFYLVPA